MFFLHTPEVFSSLVELCYSLMGYPLACLWVLSLYFPEHKLLIQIIVSYLLPVLDGILVHCGLTPNYLDISDQFRITCLIYSKEKIDTVCKESHVRYSGASGFSSRVTEWILSVTCPMSKWSLLRTFLRKFKLHIVLLVRDELFGATENDFQASTSLLLSETVELFICFR